jgi:hypothetical protein
LVSAGVWGIAAVATLPPAINIAAIIALDFMEGIELLEPWVYICLKVTKIIVNLVTLVSYLQKKAENGS